MRTFVRRLPVPTLIGMVMFAAAGGAQAQDACAAPDKQQACSVQCCGRNSCPPACELDCVKSCVDGCGSEMKRGIFRRDLKTMQIRCGNPSQTRGLQGK